MSRQLRPQIVNRQTEPFRCDRFVVGHKQNVLSLKVAFGGCPPVFDRDPRISAEQVFEFSFAPHEELALFAFAVGVGRAVEAALG